jgi:predicted nucleic acid-binding protein
MIALFDVNVLIALLDSPHVHHAPASRFFPRAQAFGWATCPLTENGVLRILGRPGSTR